MHAICAASQQYFILKSNKREWRFYCSQHPPREAAVFDISKQAWFTSETMSHLQELRHVLERGRMIIEMARQRDRQKKRMLNLCEMRQIELSMEMILKKRPTSIMKDLFEKITGVAMEEIPKPAPVIIKKVNSKKRTRVISVEENTNENEKEEVVKRTSSRLKTEPTVVEPSKSNRKRGEESAVIGERRSRRLEAEPVEDSAQTSRKKRGVTQDDVTLEQSSRKRSRRGEALQEVVLETTDAPLTSRHRSRRNTAKSETDEQLETEKTEPTASRRTSRQRSTEVTPEIELEQVSKSNRRTRRDRSVQENTHEIEIVTDDVKKMLLDGLFGSTDTITVEDFDDVICQAFPEACK